MSRNQFDSFEAFFAEVEQRPGYWAEQVKLELAFELERLLKRRALSKKAFATRIDSSPSYVTKLLRGNVNCTIDNMARLAHVLGGRVHLRLDDEGDAAAWVRTRREETRHRAVRLAVLSQHQGPQPISTDWSCANDSEPVAA